MVLKGSKNNQIKLSEPIKNLRPDEEFTKKYASNIFSNFFTLKKI